MRANFKHCSSLLFLGVALLLLCSQAGFAVGPTLLRPTAAEYVSLPVFDWDDVVTKPFAGSYEIQLDDSSDCASPFKTAVIPALISFYSPNEELAPATYFWRVRHLPVTGSPGDWSSCQQFAIGAPPHVISVDPEDGWEEIKAKLESALTYSHDNDAFAELRFPEEATFELEQVTDPTHTDAWNESLFYIQNGHKVVINGRGSTIRLQATRGRCGFFTASMSSQLQIKDFVVDYALGSLNQMGGEIVALNPSTRTFTVDVDPDVYQNETAIESMDSGFFIDAEHGQRIGETGQTEFEMTTTWQGARIGSTHQYEFTAISAQSWSHYGGELKVGDFFVSTDKSGGNIVFLYKDVDDFVANGITALGSRGSFYVVRKQGDGDSELVRSLDNRLAPAPGRIRGAAGGGVNDKGIQSWHENLALDRTRDDAFHTGVPVGSQNVLLHSTISSAFRNTVWVQADRSWVEDNTLLYGGNDGLALGGKSADEENRPTFANQVSVALIKDNRIVSPRNSGIVSRARSFDVDPDEESGDVSEYVSLVGNRVRDHQSDEGIWLDYLADSTVSGNVVESVGIALHPNDAAWRLYSDPALQIGLHATNSHDVAGADNEIRDGRIACAKRLVVESSTNVSLGLASPTSGLHESWNCASTASYSVPGSLTGDHVWTINANNFRVDVVDKTPTGSRWFGRTESSVLSGGSGSGVDKHTTPLPQTLAPATHPITIHARFAFNAVTTQSPAAARFGVEETSTGALYMIGVLANTPESPIVLSVKNASVSLGTAGDQTTSGVWELVATFTRASASATTVEYIVRRPNGAPYTGSVSIPAAISSTTAFDQGFFTFKKNAQVVFDSAQILEAD